MYHPLYETILREMRKQQDTITTKAKRQKPKTIPYAAALSQEWRSYLMRSGWLELAD